MDFNIKCETSEWYECKVSYTKLNESGKETKVNEIYAVDAYSCMEAEKKVTEELNQYIDGVDLETVSVSKTAYKEVWRDNDDNADLYYKVKLRTVYLDEQSGKEKNDNQVILVQASGFDAVVNNIKEILSKCMLDVQVVEVKETKIVDALSKPEIEK